MHQTQIMKYLLIGITALLLFACKTETEKVEDNDEKICFYTLDETQISVQWTAFKFTEKTAVKGSFTDVKITSNTKTDDKNQLFKDLTLKINTQSVNSTNEERDTKLKELFFGQMSSNDIIAKLKKDEGKVEVTMNNVTRDEEAEILEVNDQLFVKFSIDMMNYNLTKSFQDLAKACQDLHIGPDGKSKLWTTVDLEFIANPMSDCDK